MTALTKVEKLDVGMTFDHSQIDLLKSTICKGSSDDELMFFVNVCKRTGLDPFARQIYSVPRAGQRVIQISVDGFRLIAERSGRYSPGKESSYTYRKDGSLESATSFIMKQTRDGHWHTVAATAYFDEYDGKTNLWKKMPRTMLAKCAECLALRKAFPAEMSGLYAEEEMHQADVKHHDVKPLYSICISHEKSIELGDLLMKCSPEVQKNFVMYLSQKFKITTLDDLPENEFEKHKEMLIKRRDEYQKQLAEAEMTNVNKETGEIQDAD